MCFFPSPSSTLLLIFLIWIFAFSPTDTWGCWWGASVRPLSNLHPSSFPHLPSLSHMNILYVPYSIHYTIFSPLSLSFFDLHHLHFSSSCSTSTVPLSAQTTKNMTSTYEHKIKCISVGSQESVPDIQHLLCQVLLILLAFQKRIWRCKDKCCKHISAFCSQ